MNGKILFFIVSALIVLVIGSFIWISKLLTSENIPDIAVEFHGMIFDVILFGIILTIYEVYSDKKQKEIEELTKTIRLIERYKEEIDDYRGWHDNEAAFRVAGIIRRLKQLDVLITDLDFLNLSRVPLEQVFKNKKLTGVMLEKITEFNNVNFDEYEYSDSIFIDCLFSKSKINQCHWIKNEFKHCIYEDVVFKNSKLMMNKFHSSTFKNVEFSDANFSGSDFSGSNFHSIRIQKSKLELSNLSNCIIKGCKAVRINFYQSNFSKSTLGGVDFSGSELLVCDFSFSTIENCNFQGCYLKNATFDNSRLCDVDFRGASLIGISMKNTKIGYEGNDNFLDFTYKVGFKKIATAFESQKDDFMDSGLPKSELEKIDWIKE